MSQQLPSKLLRFRNSSGVQVFYPTSAFRGIFRNGNYAEFFFTPLQNAVGEENANTGESDKVKVLFSNPGDGMWTAIINFYNKLHTGKGLVYTVADVAASGGAFYGFGSNGDIHVDNSTPSNTVVIEVSAV